MSSRARHSPNRDRIICAWIHGTSSRLTATGEPTGDARHAAIAELRETASADGRLRTDLLSREVGLFTGLADGGNGNEQDQRRLRWMAALCREAAGDRLDEVIVAEWVEIGKKRAHPPMPGPPLR